MIDIFSLYLLAQTDSPVSIAPWMSVLTGSGGALAVLGFWVKTLLSEKRDLIANHREKDRELVAITRESIACIESAVHRADLGEDFRQRLEMLLGRIETKLSNLS